MSSSKDKIDEDILAFIAESRELLEEIEPQLVILSKILSEEKSVDVETINLIFRAFHTIKGTAAFYQFDNVVGVTHKAETLLDYFRNGIADINVSCTELLCLTCDAVEKLFQKIETTGVDSGDEELVTSISSKLNELSLFFKDNHNNEQAEGSLDETITGKKEISDQPGSNTSIFIAEARSVFEEIRDVVTKISEQANEKNKIEPKQIQSFIQNINIVAETAGFLKFENIENVLNKLNELLVAVENKDSVFSKQEIELFVYCCEVVKHTLNEVEKHCNDKGIEGHVKIITEGVKDPEAFSKKDYSVVNEEIIISLDEDEVPKKSGEEIFKIDSQMSEMFFDESMEQIDYIEDMLLILKDDVTDKSALGETFRLLHSFKGSCGFMNYGDLEELTHKTETLIGAAFDGILILDEWDLKAIWFVIGIIRQTLDSINEGESGKILNIAVLVYMLEYITSFTDENEKFAEMLLPPMEKPRPVELELKGPQGIENKDLNRGEAIDQELINNLIRKDESSNLDQEKNITGTAKELNDNIFNSRKIERKDIRVNLSKLDELINLIGELVIAENMVIKNPDVVNRDMENFEKASVHLSKIVRDLQDVALSVRMIPISGVFRKMIRLVHDLSAKTNKKIGLKLIGEDTEIDKTVAELIADPLVHLIRNSIDHGIEKMDGNKPGQDDGKIILEARHEGGEVWVVVSDDGNGLDVDRILQKGIENGLVAGDGEHLSEQEIIELIFHPGFSTSNFVTAVSGRGVGMDVVKKNIEKIKGHIDVYSKPGQGTTFVMRIPLTLAIIDGMLVRVGEASYTIPLLSIRESIQVDPENVIITMDGQEVVKVRDELIPVIRLHRLYDLNSDYEELHEGILVIIEHQRETACLFIDEIVGEQQTVIKGLSNYMENIKGVSGCTILGDGEVSLILDAGGLIKRTFSDGVSCKESTIQ